MYVILLQIAFSRSDAQCRQWTRMCFVQHAIGQMSPAPHLNEHQDSFPEGKRGRRPGRDTFESSCKKEWQTTAQLCALSHTVGCEWQSLCIFEGDSWGRSNRQLRMRESDTS